MAYSIPPIKERLEKVKAFRLASKAESTRLYANRPYLFKQRAHIDTDSIIVPSVSSEKRRYLPVGMLDENSIISNASQAIYHADMFVLGLLCTHIHVVWLSAIGGKLETRYRYSVLVYNSFPFPSISDTKKSEIERRQRMCFWLVKTIPRRRLQIFTTLKRCRRICVLHMRN